MRPRRPARPPPRTRRLKRRAEFRGWGGGGSSRRARRARPRRRRRAGARSPSPRPAARAAARTNTTVTIATSWAPTRTIWALSTSMHSAAVSSWRSASTVAVATRRWRAVEAIEPSAKPTASSSPRASVTRTRERSPLTSAVTLHEHRPRRPGRRLGGLGVRRCRSVLPSWTTETIRRSSSIPKLARATDWTSRTTCLACLAASARMWTSVGRPLSSVTTRAAETSGSRHSSRSSSRTSSSGPPTTVSTAASGLLLGQVDVLVVVGHGTPCARVDRVYGRGGHEWWFSPGCLARGRCCL